MFLPNAILLTGFGPFRNHTFNPSEGIVRLLDDKNVGSMNQKSDLNVYKSQVLPVNHDGASWTATCLSQCEELPWKAIIHLGLNAAEESIRVETMALNSLADCKGARIDPTGPLLLPTTLPLNEKLLNDYMEEKSAICQWSRDAGDFYCNETFYRTLSVLRRSNRYKNRNDLVPCLFVHVPEERKMSIENVSIWLDGFVLRLLQSLQGNNH